MTNKKALFVTGLCMGMLLVILIGLLLLEPVAFEILVGILALWGFVELAQVFYFWLLGDVPEVEPEKPPFGEWDYDRSKDTGDENIDTASYDEILAEMKNEPTL